MLFINRSIMLISESFVVYCSNYVLSLSLQCTVIVKHMVLVERDTCIVQMERKNELLVAFNRISVKRK